MKKLFLLFWLVLTGLGIAPYCLADDLSEYEIVFQYKGIEKIDFIHKGTNTIVKSFDVCAENPYNHLDLPILKTEWGIKYYDLRQVNPKEIAAKFNLPLEKLDTGSPLYEAFSWVEVYDPNKDMPPEMQIKMNYTVVIYQFDIRRNPEKIAAVQSTIIVLNAKGEETFRLEGIPTNCQSPCITQDGRYLGFRHGAANDESLIPIGEEGFQIYDLQTKTLIVDKKLEPAYGYISGPFIKLERMVFKMRGSKSIKYFFYDFKNRISYSKSYPLETYTNGIAYTPNGLTPRNASEDTFEKDFEKEAF